MVCFPQGILTANDFQFLTGLFDEDIEDFRIDVIHLQDNTAVWCLCFCGFGFFSHCFGFPAGFRLFCFHSFSRLVVFQHQCGSQLFLFVRQFIREHGVGKKFFV